MSGARAVTSLELRRHLKSTLSTSPKGTSSSKSNSPVKTIKRLAKVRRDLFGPIDRDESTRFIETEMARKQTQDSERWGFDFSRGVPLVNNENYEWEPVYTFIPQYYKIQHSRERLSTSTTAENQLQYFQNPDDLPVIGIDKKLYEDLEPKHGSGTRADIIERTPLQSHSNNNTSKNSNNTSTQQPKKFRQICITDLLENRKRISSSKTNVSSTNKSTVSSTISQSASCSSSNNINNCSDTIDGVQPKKPKYSFNNSM